MFYTKLKILSTEDGHIHLLDAAYHPPVGTWIYYNGNSYGHQTQDNNSGIYQLKKGDHYSIRPKMHPIIEILREDKSYKLVLKANYNFSFEYDCKLVVASSNELFNLPKISEDFIDLFKTAKYKYVNALMSEHGHLVLKNNEVQYRILENKSILPEFKDSILKSFKRMFIWNNVDIKKLNSYISDIDAIYDNLPQSLIDGIDEIPYYAVDCIITVEITTKKKGKVVAPDPYGRFKIGDIINLQYYIVDIVHHKQLVSLNMDIEGDSHYILNMKPKKFCSDSMGHQFRFEKVEGLYSTDNFVRFKSGQYYAEIKNGITNIEHCPFCGTKLDNYEQT